jgi:hypothetical protein
VKETTHSRWLLCAALCFSAIGWPLQQAAASDTIPLATGLAGVFGSAAVNSEDLENSRGGADVVLNDIRSDGVVRDNQASNLTTGNNWVTDGSFTGATGFPTVVQNSGNNVLIQNATIINLQVQ